MSMSKFATFEGEAEGGRKAEILQDGLAHTSITGKGEIAPFYF